jgi:hypothetical protein
MVWSGTPAAPLGRLTAPGKPFAVQRAAVFRLKDKKVVRVSFFTNGQELARAAGKWPPVPE